MGLPDVTRQRLVELLGPKRAVVDDPDRLEPYAQDESGLGTYPPDAVALVESAEEVREVLRMAALDRVPVTPRGAGTGMTGGALAVEGGVVLSTERLAQIKDIDTDNLLAVVEPGVITGQLQEMVEDCGLFYPPDPASLDSCSMGGNVAENAGGPRAFKYGVTREYVLGLELMLIGGKRLHVGRRTVKGVTGLDLVALTVGSEGTLSVVTEITVKLLPKPQAVCAFLGQFPDPVSATEAVTRIIAGGHLPRTLEFLDGNVLEHLRRKGGWPIPPGAGAMLLVELDGDADGIEAQMLEAAEVCEDAGAVEIHVATDEARRRQMWEMRRNANPALKEQHPFKISEDIVVPRAAIPEMVRRLDRLAAEHDVYVATFGHAGDGNLHVNVLSDDEEQTVESLEPVLAGIFAHALELGGTLTGEHGVGIAKKRFMALEQQEEVIQLQRELKRVFDPEGLLNPGKLFPDRT
jgi:glycolate oxidase